MSLLGIDIGTTGCKAIVFRVDGTPLGQAYREYPLLHPREGWIELDPRVVWEAVRQSIREAAHRAGPGDPVRALSTSVQGESVTPVGRDGEPLANSPVTFDGRTIPLVSHWEESPGAERVFEITGMPLHSMYTLLKIFWWRREQPQLYEHTARFLCYGDFALHQMGLTPTIDPSMAGRTMAFDVRAGCWSEELLARAGVAEEKLPVVAPSGTAVGELPAAVCDELGLPRGVIGAAGGHDQPCGALGAGITSPGLAMDATGTVECITPVFDRLLLSAAMREGNFCCYRHVAPDLYATLAFNFTGGSLLRWYRDTLGAREVDEARVAGMDVYEIMIGKAASGPARVLLLPHFTMTGTPWFDPHAKGAIVGLTLGTGVDQVLKAMLDGITYEMRLNLERLADAGVPVRELRAIGGGAKSRTWLQLKADIFGRPVSSLDVSEAACLGAAMLAGMAVGEFRSLGEATEALVRVTATFEPRPAEAARYDEIYALYRDLYPALRDLVHRLPSAS
jgi:xylulokinase